MIVDRAARSLILVCCVWMAAAGCKQRQSEPASQAVPKTGEQSSVEDSSQSNLQSTIRFEAAAERLGIHFERYDDIRGERRIIESTGGGVGCFDYDCDGRIDVLFTGGCKLPLPADEPLKPTCGLFQNDWPTQFRDVSSASRLAQGGYCQGVAVGDFDSDGFDDVYIAAFGENGMWHNCGDGTFQCVTADAGVQCSSWSTSTATSDLNQDGLLDLYVVNYLKESAEHPLKCPNQRAPDGFEQCPPAKYEGVDDVLFLNNGDGTFRDATETCGLKGKLGKGLGVAIFDFDGDFKPEIYVANDGEANYLLCNTAEPGQDPVYEDRGLTSGVALNYSGYAQASMGVAAGDYDQDGKVDLFLTNFYGDSSTVYRNFGGLHFEDLTRSTGLTGPSRKSLGWGDHTGRLR
ncbi:MAG: VCBS repeat-containing protein [Pirellulales bacterium]